MKCAFCHVNEARHDPKPHWNITGKLCPQCYDYKYVHDPTSLVNRPTFRKMLNLSKKKWFIGLVAAMLIFSVLMRLISEN